MILLKFLSKVITIKFIFPKNYKTSGRLFGIVDYGFATFICCFSYIVFFILNNLNFSFNIKIFIFITTVLPIFLFGITQTTTESFFTIIFYLARFFFSPSCYLFSKNIYKNKISLYNNFIVHKILKFIINIKNI